MINIFNLFHLPMKRLAKRLGAEFVLLNQDSHFSNAMRSTLAEFKNLCKAKYPFRKSIDGHIRNLAKLELSDNEYVSHVYDIEYTDMGDLKLLTNKPKTNGVSPEMLIKLKGKCHYGFLNALLLPDGLTRISGYTITELEKMKICDVGSGSGELEEHLLSLGVPPTQVYSVDISPASVERQKRLGINAYEGTINVLPTTEKFDLIFLSYFIDYDIDQLTTFASAIKHANHGAKIILEGLLPARPPEHVVQQLNTTVTCGNFAFEDASLITQAFENLSREVTRTAKLERLVIGVRYVYSRIGFFCLPSYFLVFKII